MMIEVAIMIEGQNGLTWPRWQAITQKAEELGFVGVYRSDHYTNARPPDKESLELWVSMTWLASHSSKLEFGQLVSPPGFRHPSITARMAAALDDLSGGRFHLGLGAGWQEREHDLFGLDLLEVPDRMDRFEEYLKVTKRLLRSDEPVSFDGQFYDLEEAILLPRPQRAGGPPIVVGGNGPLRTMPLAAEHADEWNAIGLTPAAFAEKNKRMDKLVADAGRTPADLRRTMMVGTVFAQSEAELDKKLEARGAKADELRDRGVIVGTAEDFTEQVLALGAAGLQRVMLQWLDLDDLEGLQAMAEAVLPGSSAS
jgi:F420-dependent oxidoreductase-like protein